MALRAKPRRSSSLVPQDGLPSSGGLATLPPFYRSVVSRPALRPFVESIWIQEAEAEHGSRQRPTLVLPSGAPEIILYYGDPFIRWVGESHEREPKLAFCGQRARPIRVAATGRTGIIIVRFHAWGAAELLGDSMAALRDRVAAFSDVAGRDGARLEERLLETCCAADRLRLLQGFLEPRLTLTEQNRLAKRAVLAIRRASGSTPIRHLARELGISRRHLARRFADAVGMSPKSFAALMRFQESLRYRDRERTWAEVAAACGFFDQAHLIRSWRQFAGAPPRRLLAGSGATPLAGFFNDPAKSHSYNTSYL